MKVHQYNEMMRYLTRKPTPIVDIPVEALVAPAETQAASIEDLTAQENAAAAEHHYATGGRVEYAEGTDIPSMTNIGEDVVRDAKGIYEKYVPKITKGAATTLRVIGTPAVSAALYVHDIIDDLKEAANKGSITASKALDAFVGKGEKGLYFMLPELAKDVVTNPIASKTLQLFGIGKYSNPAGATISAVGVGKDVYDQYQDFKKLPPEQKEIIKEQILSGGVDEMGNRTGQKNGGRIGYAEESDDELPTLNTEEEYFGKKIKDIPERDITGPRVGFMDVKKRPNVQLNKSEEEGGGGTGGIRELKQLLLNNMQQLNPMIGYGGENYNAYISKGINPYGDKALRYGASYSPEGDKGMFTIDKGPGSIGAGYQYVDDNLRLGIGALKDKLEGKGINLTANYKF